jgi:hypothetical protein
MGDVTTLWIVEVMELWLHSNETARLRAAWPAVIAGMQWQIAQSAALGLPIPADCAAAGLAPEQFSPARLGA